MGRLRPDPLPRLHARRPRPAADHHPDERHRRRPGDRRYRGGVCGWAAEAEGAGTGCCAGTDAVADRLGRGRRAYYGRRRLDRPLPLAIGSEATLAAVDLRPRLDRRPRRRSGAFRTTGGAADQRTVPARARRGARGRPDPHQKDILIMATDSGAAVSGVKLGDLLPVNLDRIDDALTQARAKNAELAGANLPKLAVGVLDREVGEAVRGALDCDV